MTILETAGLSSEIENLIEESKQSLVIVSPYLKIHSRLKPKLTSCLKRGVNCLIVYRTDSLQANDLGFFESLSGVKLLPIKNLHAKCYLNDSVAILSSMNLYDYSQINNHEMGVKFSRHSEEESYNRICEIIRTIVLTDFPDFSFDNYFLPLKSYTMGDLYVELSSLYNFPSRPNTLDSTYVLMSRIAQQVHAFPVSANKANENILKRSTILDYQLWKKIRAEIIKVGVLKESK